MQFPLPSWAGSPDPLLVLQEAELWKLLGGHPWFISYCCSESEPLIPGT